MGFHLLLHDFVRRAALFLIVDKFEPNRRFAIVLKFFILALAAAATQDSCCLSLGEGYGSITLPHIARGTIGALADDDFGGTGWP